MNYKFTQITLLCMTVGLIALGPVHAQPPDTIWTRTYGGSEKDFMHSLQKTSDDGYILAGYTESFGAGGRDMFVVKVDSMGNTVWDRTYGGTGSEECYSVLPATNGSYALAGYTSSYGPGSIAAYLVKIDGQGNILWEQTYGGIGSDRFLTAQITPDGGYILGGQTDSFGAGINDFYLVKTDSQGEQEWYETFGGEGTEWCNTVQVCADNGYILGGIKHYFGTNNKDTYVVKTDIQGNFEWEQTFGESGFEACYSIKQTPDGGYIVGGRTESMGAGSSEMHMLKLNPLGNLQWQQTYGGSNNERCMDIQLTPDGGYMLGGRTETYGAGTNDMFLVKTDALGNQQWQQTVGGPEWEYCESFCQTLDGGFVLGGMTASFGAGNFDFYLVKMGPAGIVPWLVVSVSAVNPPVIIPAGGGTFELNIDIRNHASSAQMFDFWSTIEAPGNLEFLVLEPVELTLNPGMNMGRLRSQGVPPNAPSGLYHYWGFVGDFPWYIVNCDSFSFEKEGSGDDLSVAASGFYFDSASQSDRSSRETASVEVIPLNVHPNPLNQTTRLSFTLPEASRVTLDLYDISGRLVTTLANGWRDAGVHEVLFNASDLTAGIYIYHLAAEENVDSGKIVLIK